MKHLISIWILLLFTAGHILAAETCPSDSTSKSGKPVVFLDCADCDMEYFRESLDIIAYSRDSKAADVVVIATTMSAGNGGSHYTLEFSGQKRFSGMLDTLGFNTAPSATEEEVRLLMLSKLELGLVPYILKTPQAERINVFYSNSLAASDQPENDPWNNWVFSTQCMGSASMEKSFRSANLMAGFYAGRVTEVSKIEVNTNFNYAESSMNYPISDGYDTTFRYFMQDYSSTAIYVKSIGKHFGAGMITGIMNSSFNNLDLQMCIAPAIEYSLYEYDESSRRQLRFLYSVGYEHSNYHELTVNQRMDDRLFKQQLRIGYMMKEKFGQVSAEFMGSNYLHDFSSIDLGFMARTNVNICKGLSVNANCSVLLPQTQRSMPGGEFDAGQVLTGQQQRETDFRMTFGFGFSFWFGSKTNNVVNPRFEL